jgi:hypothetical protein
MTEAERRGVDALDDARRASPGEHAARASCAVHQAPRIL